MDFTSQHGPPAKLAEGATEGELLEDYPHLTTEDIRAAIALKNYVG